MKMVLLSGLTLIFAVTVLLTMYWDAKIEPIVGIDVPNIEESSAEGRSMMPYVCEQFPEKCMGEPLTFRGQYDEKLSRFVIPSEENITPIPSQEEKIKEITDRMKLHAMAELIHAALDNLVTLDELHAACKGMDAHAEICSKLPNVPYLWNTKALEGYKFVKSASQKKSDESWGDRLSNFFGEYIKVQESSGDSPSGQIKEALMQNDWNTAEAKLRELPENEQKDFADLILQLSLRNNLKTQYRLLMKQIVSIP